MSRQGQESQNSLALLHNPASNCDGNAPVITFALNKHCVSGGFGDRLRGMVTTYYLAVMINSFFAIHWTHPDNLSDYLIVASCNAHERSRNHDQISAIEGTAVDSQASTPLPANGAITRTAIDDWTYFSDFSFMEDTGRHVEIHTMFAKSVQDSPAAIAGQLFFLPRYRRRSVSRRRIPSAQISFRQLPGREPAFPCSAQNGSAAVLARPLKRLLTSSPHSTCITDYPCSRAASSTALKEAPNAVSNWCVREPGSYAILTPRGKLALYSTVRTRGGNPP